MSYPARVEGLVNSTYIVPTYNVEFTNGINYGGNLQLVNKPQTVPPETERMPQGAEWNGPATLYYLRHPQRDKQKGEMQLERGLITKKCTIWYHKAG